MTQLEILAAEYHRAKQALSDSREYCNEALAAYEDATRGVDAAYLAVAIARDEFLAYMPATKEPK